MRKFLLFLISVFVLPAVFGELPEGTYGSGLYGSGLYGVQSSAKATFTSDVAIQPNSSVNIEANQSNTTLEIITDSSYSGFVTIVRYDSAPSGTGSSPASALNKYVSISTGDIDLNYSIINVKYSDIEISSTNLQENSIRLYKWNGSQWIKFDGAGIGGVDTSNNFVFANTTSFSTWGVFGSTNPSPSQAPSGGGGGGGGGGGTYIPLSPSEPITYSLNLIKGQVYDFNVNGKIHKLEIKEINVADETARILFQSESTELLLKLNVPDYINYDNDNFYDLEVILTKIYGSELVTITITTVHLSVPSGVAGIPEPIIEPEIISEPIEETIPAEEEIPEKQPQETPQKPKYKFGLGQFLGVVAIILIIAGIFYYLKKTEKAEKEKEENKDASNKKGNQ